MLSPALSSLDVVNVCKRILDIPGHSETNYNALFYMGYASMRLGDYCSAVEFFLRAHRIDSCRVALRLAMHDLRRKIAMRPLRKANLQEVSVEKSTSS